MVTCEACGNEAKSLVLVNISGSQMRVCNSCKSLGTLVERDNSSISHSFRKKHKDKIQNLGVAENYVSTINKALAKRGFNFHQLAKGTNIKESSLTKYLSGKINLDVETARKIEHFLDIKIVEELDEVNESDFIVDDSSDNSMSLGDLLKKQLKK